MSQVPVEVRDGNVERMSALETEKGHLERAMDGFKKIAEQ